MARRTIVGDGLAVGAGMAAIMAAEATRRIVVPKIVGMSAPSQAHIGEDVAKIDRCDLIAGLLDQSAPRFVNLRIVRAVKIIQFFDDASFGDIPRGSPPSVLRPLFS